MPNSYLLTCPQCKREYKITRVTSVEKIDTTLPYSSTPEDDYWIIDGTDHTWMWANDGPDKDKIVKGLKEYCECGYEFKGDDAN